jgi:hypothetical protein
MGTRVQLHNKLQDITDNVYYQPPESHKMEYPCIRYQRIRIDTEHASNNPYIINKGYQIIAISTNPDDEIVDAVAKITTAVFERRYTYKNLYHDIFNIIY